MQEINTYKDLKDAVALWLNRKDQIVLDNIPNFINFAEKQFTRLVKLPYYEALSTFDIQDGFPFIVLPQDLLSVKTVLVNGEPYYRTNNELFFKIQKWENARLGKGADYQGLDKPAVVPPGMVKARTFCRVGERVYFYPTVQKGDKVELIYQQDIPEMSNDTDQPYYLLVAPEVMLYLALRHASLFLRDEEREQYWAAKAADTANALMLQLDEAEWSGSTLQTYDFDS